MARRALLALLGLALAATLLGGLARLWSFAFPTSLIAHHGLLMGGVLLPTLISLERAVALSNRWSGLVPLLGLLTAFSILTATGPSDVLLVALGLGLFVQHLVLAWRRPGLDAHVSLLAVALLLIADGRWVLHHNAAECALSWASFLILLIGAERIELSFLGNSRAIGLLAAELPGRVAATINGRRPAKKMPARGPASIRPARFPLPIRVRTFSVARGGPTVRHGAGEGRRVVVPGRACAASSRSVRRCRVHVRASD